MKTFFTVKTAAYEGPELGPKDTVSVEIQRYDASGLINSREKLVAMVVNVEPIFPAEPDLDRVKEMEVMGDDDEKLTDYWESREGPRDDSRESSISDEESW